MKRKFTIYLLCVLLSSCPARDLEPQQPEAPALAVQTSALAVVSGSAAESESEQQLPAIYNVSETATNYLTELNTAVVPFAAPEYGSLYGLCDLNGNVAVTPAYTKVTRVFYNDTDYIYIMVQNFSESDTQITITTPDASVIYGPFNGVLSADAYSDGDKGYVALQTEDGYILISLENGVIAESEYIGRMSQGLAPVKNKRDRSYHYIDSAGNIALPEKYQYAASFYGDCATARQDGLWGLTGTDGEWLVPPAYDMALDSSGGVCAVMLNGQWGMINTAGEALFAFEYSLIKKLDSSVYLFEREGESFYYDAVTGKVIKNSDSLRYLCGGIFLSQCEDRITLTFERTGTAESIVGGKFIKALNCDYFEIAIDGRTGLYKAGQGFIFQIKDVSLCQSYIKDGVVTAKNSGGKFGVYSLDGARVLDFEYDSAEPLGFGMFKVKQGLNSGIVSENGDWILRF